ncbi:MAG: chromate efflux transporter [Gammaproteobacteria bacterium]|nr:chromate efflux transporter [Gammaproteobacteria bacterium]
MTSPQASSGPSVSFTRASRVWLRIALLSFGGPAGQIAVMHRILVDEKKWISENRFLHALNYCMLLPGPEAQQLATYAGWMLHGTRGGLVAGTLFVLPGFVSILLLSVLYAGFQHIGLVQGLFFGIKAAVLAVVIEAVLRIGKRALKNAYMYAIAAGAFVAIFFLDLPFPLIIATAAFVGFIGSRVKPDKFVVITEHGAASSDAIEGARTAKGRRAQPTLRRTLTVSAICLALWFVPLIALSSALGFDNVFTQIGLFFSKLAVVTFGGAYAVLAYMAQEAVQSYGWLEPGEMLDGLGMAETTPGPLIQVTQFVAFMGAFRNAGGLDPMLAGVLASILATWVTFVPCFLWIFLGAPYVERLQQNRSLSAALSAITAAVVGVIVNLAVWFGMHVVFDEVEQLRGYGVRLYLPGMETVDFASLALAAGAFVAMLRFRVGMLPVIGTSAALGAFWFLVS